MTRERIHPVPEFDADYYRDRPSEEILNDQATLERLRMEAMIHHYANWEWDRESYTFKVSPEWQDLTGYAPRDWFPQNLKRSVPIEQLLDNLIDRWMCMVAEVDRATLKHAAEQFLLYNNADNYFKAGYRLICADGTIKNVKTEARSMWREVDGVAYLMRLIVKTEDIGDLIKPVDQAIAINENREAIVQQATEIDSSQSHIAAIEKQAKELQAKLNSILGLLPLVLAFVVGFSDAIAQSFESVRHTWSLISSPPKILENPRIKSPDVGLAAVDEKSLEKIEALLKGKTPLGDRVKLGAYDPGIAPERYQILIVAQQDGSPDQGYYRSAPQSTSGTPFESARAQNHMANQPAAYADGKNYQYSTPFQVVRGNGITQTFYVAIDATDVDDREGAKIQAATRELSGNIKAILQESLSKGID
jgi:PAS domain-containing protein